MSTLKNLFSRRIEMGLLIVAALIIAVMLVSLELSQGNTLTTELLWLIGGFVAIFTVAHITLCLTARQADQIILPVVALLNGIGLVMIYRIDQARDFTLANRQVLWTMVGVALLVLVLVFVRDHRLLTRYSYLLGLLGLVLLALPLVWPTSMNADARIWISIGPFSVQPGEFSKILLLLFFAQLLATKRALFNVAGYRFLGLEFPRLRDLAPVLAVWAIAIMIMAVSNDFGPALLLFATVLGMMFLSTGRISWLIIGTVLVVVGGTGVYLMSEKIQERVSNFLDPLASYDTTGFQLSQSLFGLSWGGITGTGLGQGYSAEIIPVVWSDYILSALGEEFGLVGLAAIVILFAILVTRGFRAALTVRDSYGKLVASGLSLTIAIQVFVVVGGITALLPMTGLTTPFMSAGGSSLMANYVLIGLLLRISDSVRRRDLPAASPGTGQPVLPAARGTADTAGPQTGVFSTVKEVG